MQKPDIICFSFVPWGKWARTQQLMCNLAKKLDSRVVYINPDIDLIACIEKLRSSLKVVGIKTLLRAIFGMYHWHNERILIYTPIRLIPFSGKFRILQLIEKKLYSHRISRLLNTNNFNSYILWINKAYKFDERHYDLRLRPTKQVFDWDDDWLSFAKYDGCISRDINQENKVYDEIVLRSDIVLTVSDPLYKRAKRTNSNVFMVRNATDFENFSRCWLTGRSQFKVKQLETIKPPRIGYIGHICNRINLDMIDYALRKNTELEFVFIGPVMASFKIPDRLVNNTRIHFIGPVLYHDLPHYLRYFNVMVIPHYIDDTTDAQDPIKLYDYLSTGRPIVSTRVAGVERFENLIRIVRNESEFYEAIIQSLEDDSPDQKEMRLQAGKENSWSSRAREIIDILDME